MIIIPTGNHGIFSDRDNPKLKSPRRARAALPILILYAQRKDTITFRELADAIAAPDMINRTMSPILDCIEMELRKLSNHHSWVHEDIPNLTAIVVAAGEKPSGWMCVQMHEQMKVEPTLENYEHYLIKPVHKYEYWKEVINEIIQAPNW